MAPKRNSPRKSTTKPPWQPPCIATIRPAAFYRASPKDTGASKPPVPPKDLAGTTRTNIPRESKKKATEANRTLLASTRRPRPYVAPRPKLVDVADIISGHRRIRNSDRVVDGRLDDKWQWKVDENYPHFNRSSPGKEGGLPFDPVNPEPDDVGKWDDLVAKLEKVKMEEEKRGGKQERGAKWD